MKPSLDELEILRQDFNRFDTDSSGYIQGAELGQLLALQLGRQPTEHEQRTALEEQDVERRKQVDDRQNAPNCMGTLLPCTQHTYVGLNHAL